MSTQDLFEVKFFQFSVEIVCSPLSVVFCSRSSASLRSYRLLVSTSSMNSVYTTLEKRCITEPLKLRISPANYFGFCGTKMVLYFSQKTILGSVARREFRTFVTEPHKSSVSFVQNLEYLFFTTL